MTYVTVTEADAFFTGGTHTAPWPMPENPDPFDEGTSDLEVIASNETNERRKAAALALASQTVDSQAFPGHPVSPSQPHAWPRIHARDAAGRIIPNGSVPAAVKDAVCELALFYLQHDRRLQLHPMATLRRRVGDLETEFAPTVPDPLPRHVRDLLRPVLRDSLHSQTVSF